MADTYGDVLNFSPPSTAKAEVALTADTEITVFSGNMPRAGTIYRIAWSYTNVVDAKAATGYLELKSNLKQGPWRFPVGLGAGGAAATSVRHRGIQDVNIQVAFNEAITITMTMTEACVSAFAGIEWSPSGGGPTSYMDCNTAEVAAVSADTITTLATITIPAERGGRIKKIFLAQANVVNAKAASGYIIVEGTNFGGPHNYVICGGSGGATDVSAWMEAAHVEVDIPVKASEVVTIRGYFAEATTEVHAGILWE